MTDLKTQMASYAKMLELALPDFLPKKQEPINRVAEAMSYSLLAGGKRVRGILVMECCRLFGTDAADALPFAAAVEMVHAYSLIHDDLPCMDNDDTRRGKPSCHIAFGEATALLAGDGLQTLAFETLARPENAARFGCERVLSAVRILAEASGALGMVGGQMMDLENEIRSAGLERLKSTDAKKTGALISAACEIGCVLGGASAASTAMVLDYAAKVGLAFQIRDDILDVLGNADSLGKPVGSDSVNHRATYASILGVRRAGELAVQLTEEAVDSLKATELDTDFLCGLARELAGRSF